MKNLGEIFIGGRNVNLDSTSIEELEKYSNFIQWIDVCKLVEV